MSPKVSGDHAHACVRVCARMCMRVCVYVCVRGPAGVQWGLRRVFTFRATFSEATQDWGRQREWLQPGAWGSPAGGGGGLLPPTLARQGEQKCSVDVSIFLSHGDVS